jgi:hypothetical protein
MGIRRARKATPMIVSLLALVGGSCTTTGSEHATASTAAGSLEGAAAHPESERVAELRFEGSDFYAVPDPLPSGQPGSLIYVEEISNTFEGRVYRVLYHSRSVVDNEDVAVSGTIWVPVTPVPEGGYPIVSFGHGNDGSADMCANSRPDDPSQIWYWVEMFRLVADGYVVAYTDYEGLGTPGPFLFAINESSARSILDAARAAQDLLGPAASNHVIIHGHSLGALASLATGERAAGYAPDLLVHGVVALEGGTPITRLDPSGSSSVLMQAATSFPAVYPGVRAADILSTAAVRDLHLVEEDCDVDSSFVRTNAEATSVDVFDDPAWATAIRKTYIHSAPFPTFLGFAELEGSKNIAAGYGARGDALRRERGSDPGDLSHRSWRNP